MTDTRTEKPLLGALRGKCMTPPPVWLMRQAGRYLPEYRELRGRTKGFLDLCYTPELACEITLQPVRRFEFDGAILFSDILVVPDALGQGVTFEEGVGPRLEALEGSKDLARLSLGGVGAHLQPVWETVGMVRAKLGERVAMIGFCGAPWTVASYMIGGSSGGMTRAKSMALREPEVVEGLFGILEEASLVHLEGQVRAGAEVVQIFESWAGVWDEAGLERWCLGPCRRLIEAFRGRCPDVPVILFPRGVGVCYERFARESGADCVSVDFTVPVAWVRDHLQGRVAVQGNLDPSVLVAGGPALDTAVERICRALGSGAFVFNLGHGVVPETPPEHVARLVSRVRGKNGEAMPG